MEPLTYYQAICDIEALYGKDPMPPEVPKDLRKDISVSSWVRLKHIAEDLDQMRKEEMFYEMFDGNDL